MARFTAMPRFYFHLHDDYDVCDEEGLEFSDLEEARAHAAAEARTLIGEVVRRSGRIVLHHRIDIENKQGAVLGTVRFGDVVTIRD